jgi:PIN domain nuclease of toxin-antitoxin system
MLLDTHALLWFLVNDAKLSRTALALITDPGNDIVVSPASLWEIAIKIGLRKYRLPEPFQPFMERQLELNDFQLLPIEIKHTAVLTTLPFHHRDPFDRLLIAQAMVEEIPLISGDAALDSYPISRLW